jgi:DNA-binding LacI/PurR family transcriptional regulator
VIGFDDSPAAELAAPGLTSLRQPLDEVGRSVIRMIVGQLSGASPPRQGVLLQPTLVVRDSA